MIGAAPIATTPIASPPAGGVTTDTAAMSVVLPALTGVMLATAPSAGGLVVTLPALTAVIEAEALERAFLAVSLPALTAVVLASAPVNGTMDAVLPALTGDMAGETGPRRGLYSWQECPRPESGFAMSGRVGTRRRGGPDNG